MPIFTEKGIKIFKTCNLYLCFLMLGMCLAIPGPTLLDLKNIANTDMQHIAFIFTGRSSGYLLGSLVAGVVFDLVARKQMLLGFFSFVCTLTIFGIPWCQSIGFLTAIMTVNGISFAFLDTGGNACCLNMWGKDSGPFYQALHFCYGFGALIAPLIAAPFVGNFNASEYAIDINSTITGNTSLLSDFQNFQNYSLGDTTTLQPEFQNFLNNRSANSLDIPAIIYAYSAIGVYGAIVTLLFLIICIIAPLENQGQQKDQIKVKERKLPFVLLIVFLCTLLVFVETGIEIEYAQMLTTYAVKGPLKLSQTIGSLMTSAYWAAFSISRFLSVFLAIRFSGLQLIVFDLIVFSLGAVILLCFGASEVWAVWLATALLGAGIASFLPSLVGWVEKYITVNSKVYASICVGASLAEMVIPYVVSFYIEMEPRVLIYTEVAACALVIGITTILWLILRKRQPRYLKNEGTVNAGCNPNAIAEQTF